MMSIANLFEETKNDIPKKHSERMARRYRYFDKEAVDYHIPHIDYPKANSPRFKLDLQEVERCYSSPSLSTDFLRNSDSSIEEIFKTYCKESGYNNIDWKAIKEILEDVDSIVLSLKYKFNRPRPIHFFDNSEVDQEAYKKSPSYPSGHTAIAYFICDLISNFIPESRQDLQTLASLIGQSRIENAVHYPTDVEYGRYVGETLANLYCSNNSSLSTKGNTKKHHKEFSDYILENSKSWYEDNHIENLINDFADFLFTTNDIESYTPDYNQCLDASKMCIEGYPTDYITDNPHLASQINGIITAYKHGNIDNIYKIQDIHRNFNNVLERGFPGEIRNFIHSSPAGIAYSEPHDIVNCLKNMFKINIDPWAKHVVYEWIHPFCDGNGRSGRIMMLSDLGFNFSKANNFLGNDYIDNLVDGTDVKLFNKLFKM